MRGKEPGWYALRVRTGFEPVVERQLIRQGYEVFLPSYARRHWEPDLSRSPLFPNYIFCRSDSPIPLPILTTPGVLCAVAKGKAAAPVNELEIAALKAIVSSGLQYGPCPFVEVGPKVMIMDGPLRNVEGILTNSEPYYRVAIGVSMLQRSFLVELGNGTKVKPLPAKAV